MSIFKVKKSEKIIETYKVGDKLKVKIEKIINDVSGRVSYAVVSYRKIFIFGWVASSDFANLELNWTGDTIESGTYPEYGNLENAKSFAKFIIDKRFG